MSGYSDPLVWGLVLLWRVLLGALVVLPFLYFVLQICLDFPGVYEANKKDPSWRLIRRIFKSLLRSPRNIFLACLWLSATIYVFGFAYIWPLGARALPYKIFEIRDRAHYPQISVVLEDNSIAASGGEVAATCMAAGKYYSEKLHRATVTVKVYAFPPSRYNDARLGQCTYGEISTETDDDLPFRATSTASSQRVKETYLKPVVGFLCLM